MAAHTHRAGSRRLGGGGDTVPVLVLVLALVPVPTRPLRARITIPDTAVCRGVAVAQKGWLHRRFRRRTTRPFRSRHDLCCLARRCRPRRRTHRTRRTRLPAPAPAQAARPIATRRCKTHWPLRMRLVSRPPGESTMRRHRRHRHRLYGHRHSRPSRASSSRRRHGMLHCSSLGRSPGRSPVAGCSLRGARAIARIWPRPLSVPANRSAVLSDQSGLSAICAVRCTVHAVEGTTSLADGARARAGAEVRRGGPVLIQLRQPRIPPTGLAAGGWSVPGSDRRPVRPAPRPLSVCLSGLA